MKDQKQLIRDITMTNVKLTSNNPAPSNHTPIIKQPTCNCQSHFTLLVDRAPQIELFALYFDKEFIDVKRVAVTTILTS